MSKSMGKQAKVLSEPQVQAALEHLTYEAYHTRNKVMLLLSVRAGLRAREIAGLTWGMVTKSTGDLDNVIALEGRVTKGGYGGRLIPMHKSLMEALIELRLECFEARQSEPVIQSNRRTKRMTDNSVHVWFHRLYGKLGFVGCSSHSGRRTFITKAVKAIERAGGTIRDVQLMAGHASLESTQVYIEQNSDAQQRVMELI